MVLYALTIVVSAFLLFQVEPIIAKIILPWFGGSAAVWTVCLLFFQVVLLLGYAYAHAVIRYLKPRVQGVVHVCLLLVSLAVLPIYPGESLKPSGGSDPTWGILGLLGLTIGLPYFLLSTTGPLLQAWYAREYKGAVPYRLFSLSNAGSMFALLSYPVLVEPLLTTHQQSWSWSIAYGVFALLCCLMALRSRAFAPLEAAAEGGEVHRPQPRQYAMWLLLPATTSMLLLSITTQLSQNVAAIPFLWILPLSLYLLSFILCFESNGWYRRNPYLQLLAVALGGMAYGFIVNYDGNMPIWWMLLLFGLGLFTCCMVCHGELAMLKPDPKYLTHFYLTISAGGAMGGIFVGLIAPRIFNSFYELPMGLTLCAVLVLLALSLDKETAHWFQGGPMILPVVCAAGTAYLAYFAQTAGWIRDWRVIVPVLCAAATVYVAYYAIKVGWYREWRIILPFLGAAGTVYMAFYMGTHMRDQARDSRVMVRNFYGALRVRDSGEDNALDTVRTLTNGTINHGEEYVSIAKRRLPTTYYGKQTGIGIAIREKQKKATIRLGVVGLGTGTLAAYGRLGDYIRYYEINPLVPPITRGQFFFVPTCPAQLDIAMGDARLTLEKEPPQHFDVLAVDAFSSDAIPVHLLTKEAMALFFHHLQPDGVLALHISNRYLDLQPVVEGEADALGKQNRTIDTDDDESVDVFSATWVLVFDKNSGFSPPEFNYSADIKSRRKVRLWTDDYSNLFQILK